MELPGPVKEPRAQGYERLAVTARELGDTHPRLAAASPASRQQFLSLADMIRNLQASTRHLQSQVEELKSFDRGRRSPGKRGPKSAPGLWGGRELGELRRRGAQDPVFAESGASRPSLCAQENAHLKELVGALRARLSLEQQRRGALEEQFGLVLRENEELEQRLGAASGYRARALELEAAVAEIRRLLQLERPFVVEKLVPSPLWVPFREPGQSLPEEMPLPGPEAQPGPLPRPLRRSDGGGGGGETVLSRLAGGDPGKSHEGTCTPKAKAVEQRAVSRLQELNTRYVVLKAKYEELLNKCEQPTGDTRSHKAVQTARAPPLAGASASTPPPKYKVLFKEIFSCIQKRKQIDKQRGKYHSLPSP